MGVTVRLRVLAAIGEPFCVQTIDMGCVPAVSMLKVTGVLPLAQIWVVVGLMAVISGVLHVITCSLAKPQVQSEAAEPSQYK